MRGMERQAIKTDLAVKNLGMSLDEIGSRKQVTQMENASRSTRTLGNELGNAEKKATRAERSMGNVERRTKSLRRETTGLGVAFKDVFKLMKPAMFLALGSAIGIAVQAVGNLAGGLIALMPRLSDMAGLLAPAGAGIVGLGLGLVTAKLAFSNLTKAMQGNKNALKSLTPEARSFLAQLKAYHPVIQQLRKSAQAGIFPDLTYSLARAQRGVPLANRLIRNMGSRIGGAARQATDRLTTPAALQDLESLGNQGGVVFSRMASALLNVLDVLRNFSVAAEPFTNWITRSITSWTKHRAALAEFNRDSGKTAAYLNRTKVALTNVVHIGENLWTTFRNIGQAARPLGDSLWVSMERTTKAWAQITGDPSRRVALTKEFLAMGAAFRQIAGLAGDLGKAIFNMGAQGQLGGTVSALRGLVPSLEKVLNLLANDFGPPLAQTLSSVGDLMAKLGGATGPIVLVLDTITATAKVLDHIVGAVPGLGKLLGSAFAVFALQRFLGKLGLLEASWWRVGRAAKTAAVAEGQALAVGGAASGSGFGFGFAAGRAGAATGFADAAGMGLMARLGVGLGASRLGGAAALATKIGPAALRGGIYGMLAAPLVQMGAGILGAGHRTSSILGDAAGGAAFGATVGSVIPGVGTLIGGGVGALAGGAYGYLSHPDDGTAQVNRVNQSIGDQLAQIRSYPIAIGRLTGELAIYQNAYKRLQDNHSAAAQQELGQLQQEIQARRAVVTQLRAEQAQRRRAAAATRVRGLANDLGKLFDLMVGGGASKAGAARVVNRDALRELGRTTDPKARFALAKGLLNWERDVLGTKSPVFMGLAKQLQARVPGLLHAVQPGYVAQGTPQAIAGILKRLDIHAGAGGLVEQYRQRRQQAPTPLQQALIAELVAGGIDGATARRMVMMSDGVGRPPINASNVLPGSKFMNGLTPFAITPGGVKKAMELHRQMIVALYQGNTALVQRLQAQVDALTLPPAMGGPNSKGHATGGRIAGQGTRDTVSIAPGAMAAPGELVVNRHQERMADAMLGGRGALAGIVSSVRRPHWANFAAGGRVPSWAGGLHGGIRSFASRVLGRFPGLSVTSTLGGEHASGSYHYLGDAVDLGGDPQTMDAAAGWIMQSGLYRNLVEGIHNPNMSVKGGRQVPSSLWGATTWGQHRNHLHLAALGGALATAAGGAPGVGGGATTNPLGVGATNVGGGRLFGHAAVAQAAANAIMGLRSFPATGRSTRAAGTPAAAPAGGGTTTGNRALGLRMMLAHGWPRSEWPALESLWTGESGWNAGALNAGSGAFGIPQSLPASKMASAGPDWRTNPATQIAWGLNYIGGRYGSPSAALSAWNSRSPHWYANGGRLKYAGAFEQGGMFRTNGPTAFVAGDGSSPHETVTVSKGHGGGVGPTLTIQSLVIHAGGEDVKEQVKAGIAEAWAELVDELERTSPVGERWG